jgi:hypothetical protein
VSSASPESQETEDEDDDEGRGRSRKCLLAIQYSDNAFESMERRRINAVALGEYHFSPKSQ